MSNIIPILCCDGYKISHREQYPVGTEMVYSNWTPRGSRIPSVNKVILFGLQYYIKEYLIKQWNQNFFHRPLKEVVDEYTLMLRSYLGGNISTKHVEELHKLGYLPIAIRALPEGTRVPLRVPMFTIYNTLPSFFWLTNALETQLSCVIWQPCTSATIAFEYLKKFHEFADITGGSKDFIPFQGHDFSYRGMGGTEAAELSGAGHLLCFAGTDTIPAIQFLRDYYNADISTELIGCSVPASEHSVMSVGGLDDEIGLFFRLITEVYPKGIVSIVSDTWDYWRVITEFLPKLKDTIMNREGKVVIRPDSGDPVKIVCGDPDASEGSPERKGSIECMWEIFGGTTNDKGFRTLDQHIGLIYGDSITMERQQKILEQLAAKGFASDNIVLGVGSFTYQYNTRDTFGFALKTTGAIVNGKFVPVFKSPKGDALKKSARGGLIVKEENGELVLQDGFSELPNVPEDKLELVFLNGKLLVNHTLSEIRTRIKDQL